MKTEKIGIVGGGTAGLVTALILKTKFPRKDITIIKSDNIGIIGVGEGTTEHWTHFMNFVGIDRNELIAKTDATLKYGVMFENWTEEPYLHAVPDELNSIRLGQYLAGYGKIISDNRSTNKSVNSDCAWTKTVDQNNLPYQYHFDTFKLNDFLEQKCHDKGIHVVKDEIIEVSHYDSDIKFLKSDSNTYNFDFYIDCTGFKKLLISKLGAKWNSYSKFLKMNSAIAFQTPDTDEYNPYTLAVAMDHGWMWRIPVWGRWGNGYVYSDKYINEDQAKKEVEKYLGHTIEIRKSVKFDPGCLDKSWIGNCAAVGLSSNFVEPLEATSIGSTINQIFILMHYLQNYGPTSIDTYNDKVNKMLENIRDFIILHYQVNKQGQSKFWDYNSTLELPDKLKQKLERWYNNLPIKEDIVTTDYVLFHEQNWTNVLYGLGKFDTAKIQEEYLQIDQKIQQKIDEILLDKVVPKIGHKQYISAIRNTVL